mmetsp:Transcript_10940/g.22948  ORF Transcript_10940/g.22948 Transcript_10940/m.22948 type:complete len:287 (+) Transcript_10940:101-961(+)
MPIIKEDPLKMSLNYNPTSFSLDKFKGEVGQAVQEDWKRDKVDDAKKRAIYSSTSYDDFKQRVAGCTLKPIHRNEFNAPPKFVYNRTAEGPIAAGAPGSAPSAAAGVAALSASSQRDSSASGPGASSCKLKNGREFERELRRRLEPLEKVELLETLDEDAFKRLFGRDVDAEVLRQVIEVLEEALPVAPAGAARRFLGRLSTLCPTSTASAASFLTAAERGIVARLLARERTADTSQDVQICAALGVQSSAVASAKAQVEEATPGAAATTGGIVEASAEGACDDMD